MGLPIIEAPGEAEAQCAAMAKSGMVYACASEDMDSITFGSPILIRNLTFTGNRRTSIMEFDLSRTLQDLKLSMDQFIDLCILLGCDYCDSIKGIGQVRALEFIRKYGCLEEILKNLDANKYKIPENFDVPAVRKLFHEPNVHKPESLPLDQLKWNYPDEEGLVQFLVKEKSFNEERVQKSIQKMKKAKDLPTQERITTYFGNPTLIRKKVNV